MAVPCSGLFGFSLGLLIPLISLGAGPVPTENPPSSVEASKPEASGVVLNVRDFGAIGDGQVHLVKEWLAEKRYPSFRRLREKYPFVDSPEWSIDEVAFTQAKLSLPANGGTIHFPVGHYVAARQPWQIWRDHVRLTGDGADRTILSTTPAIPDGLSVAPYRHVGWLENASREFPFTAETGARNTDNVQLSVAEWSGEFHRGELVFIRNGANRFDQDYGEFNEITGTEPDGRLRFKYPLARDYTLERFNWATETSESFTIPRVSSAVKVKLSTGSGHFLPSAGNTVTIGNNIFRVEKVFTSGKRGSAVVLLENPDRGNAPRGTEIPAGTPVGKSRSVIKLTRSTRDFRCENLQIIGRRKALSVSNSYETVFADCIFVRDNRESHFKGGLTIDGDGGRFVRFERCKIVGQPAAGMQFARSFGDVVFSGCTFIDTNVAFTEFNFDCEVTRCRFDVTGTHALGSVVIAGKSCGNLRFVENHLHATNVSAIFDTHSDIQSQRHGSEGDVLVRGNVIETTAGLEIFPTVKSERFAIEDNHVTTQ